MDPSCTVGFYARGVENVEAVCSAVNTVRTSHPLTEHNNPLLTTGNIFSPSLSYSPLPQVLSSSTETYPVFTFAEGHAQEEDEEGGRAVLNHTCLNSTSSRDEFVLL